MDRLKMGYVGGGFMAQKVHLPNILANERCELLALAELRPELGRKVQARHRIPKLYASHLELARDPDIRAVGVSAGYHVQTGIAIDLLMAGKDVFMEKPMAISVAQAEQVLDAERRSGRRVMVAYMKRYDPGNVRVKEAVEQFRRSGEMGALRFVRNHGFGGDWTAGLDTPMDKTDEKYPTAPASFPAWLPEPRRNGYLGYLQQWTHNINLVRWLLDAKEPVKVKAVDLDARDGMTGVVILEVGGVRTVIESGGVAYHGWDEHTQLYFEKGWIKTEAPALLLRNVPATVEIYQGHGKDKVLAQVFPARGREWSYKEEMRHFVEAVLANQPFRSPAADTLEDVRAYESIYRRFVGAAG